MTYIKEKLDLFDERFRSYNDMVCPIHFSKDIQMSDEGEHPSSWYDFCAICADESDDEAPELIPYQVALKSHLQSSLLDILKEAEMRVDGKRKKVEKAVDELGRPKNPTEVSEIIRENGFNAGINEALSVIREMMK